uniref:Uncharacterized protein n=1 Tax=Oryza brachyantha TaxID=4533 RepID=J3MZ62_ORYBR
MSIGIRSITLCCHLKKKRSNREASFFFHFTSPERRDSAQQDVEDDAGAPDVGFWPVASVENLWCHVVGAANHLGESISCSQVIEMIKYFFFAVHACPVLDQITSILDKLTGCGVAEYLPGLKNTERPKSMALRGESSDVLANRKFSGFRSLCITPFSWHSCMQHATSPSGAA